MTPRTGIYQDHEWRKQNQVRERLPGVSPDGFGTLHNFTWKQCTRSTRNASYTQTGP